MDIAEGPGGIKYAQPPRRFNRKNFHKKTVYVDRADAATLARYGATAARATETQMANRIMDGFGGNGRYKRKLRSYDQGGRSRRRARGMGLYTGGGDFLSDAWRGTAGLRGMAGRWLGQQSGILGGLGRLSAMGSAAGMGAYDTAVSNDIVDGGTAQGIPQFNSGPNTVVISHKEYISDVFGPPETGSFQNTVYSINPGIERTFPWLSQVAANYEEYTLKQCIFTFRSTVTDFVATNGQVGTLIMATQYNPSDDPFQSKQDAMEYDLAMSGKCSSNMLHGVECDPAQLSGAPGKYVRAGPVATGDDLKQYDWGNLNLGISNVPAQFVNQALGELWVSYTVELRKPKFFVSRGLNILRDTFVARNSALTPELLGDVEIGQGQQNRIGGKLERVSAGLIRYTFPATFSGSVKVRLSATVDSTVTGITTGAGVLFTPASNLPTSPSRPFGVGLIPINDMFNNGVWSYELFSPTSDAITAGGGWQPPHQDTGKTMTTEYHLQVITPTTSGVVGGAPIVDNTILFNVTTPTQSFYVPVESFQLDIEVYNTGFNYGLPFPGNTSVIENPTTGLVETWP